MNTEDSDVPSDVDWSDNEDAANGPKYTNPRGTSVWEEPEAKIIPILGDSDMKSGESLGGLQLHVLSKCRRYENTWSTEHRIFKNTKEIKLRIPIRTIPYMSYESDILMNKGEPSYISVWCPHYTLESPADEVLKQHTWSCILSFYPNLVRSERDVVKPTLNGDEKEIVYRQSTVSQYGFIFEDTFQKAGLKIPSGPDFFPSNVVSATGIAVADPMAFKWVPEEAEILPSWMNSWEIKNAMGFMRMTQYFNMIPDSDKHPSLICPKTGNYVFHILIIIPESATQLRKKFSSSLKQGGYLQRAGKRYCFNGYFVGMLNTNLLQECADHIQIPVIIPRDIFQMDDSRGGTGMFGSANSSPTKPKVPQTPTKDGEPSSSASPTAEDKKKARIKAQMKKRLQASAPSKRSTQSSSAPSGQDKVDGNGGGSSGTAPGAQDKVDGNEGGSSGTAPGAQDKVDSNEGGSSGTAPGAQDKVGGNEGGSSGTPLGAQDKVAGNEGGSSGTPPSTQDIVAGNDGDSSDTALSTQDTVAGNDGGSSDTALSTQDTVAGNNGGSSDTDAGSEGAGTNPPVESTGVAPAVSEDHAAPSTATDKGKGKRVVDDERLGDAVGANATKGARKRGKKN